MTEDGPRGVIATAEAAAAGETTAQARAAEAVSAIGDDAAFRAFAWLDPEALARAAAARDAARRAGAAAGPLEAVPLAVKDVIDTGDMPTGHGYAPHADRRPAEDAAVVAAARAAGALILGKTVTTELATFAPGPTRNPRDPRRTPGGSSSGSAAAVAAGMAPAALGTQTSGSVIRPASYCGVVGVKPTFGALSRHGVLIQAPRLDTLGVFARDVADAARLIDALDAPDPRDPAADPARRPAGWRAGAEAAVASALEGARPKLLIARTPVWDRAAPAAAAAFEAAVKRIGAALAVEIAPAPGDGPPEAAWDAHRVLMTTGMAAHYGPILDRDGPAVNAGLRALIAEGRGLAESAVDAAVARQEEIAAAHDAALPLEAVILTPAATGPAPLGLESTGDPAFNQAWTLIGAPCVTLPITAVEGAPLGVQLVGRRWEDAAVMRAARRIEAALAAAA